MFFKKKVNLKRGIPLYCGNDGHKKIPMKLLEERAEVVLSPATWMEGKEIWQCPKCHQKIYIQYKIDISKKHL